MARDKACSLNHFNLVLASRLALCGDIFIAVYLSLHSSRVLHTYALKLQHTYKVHTSVKALTINYVIMIMRGSHAHRCTGVYICTGGGIG